MLNHKKLLAATMIAGLAAPLAALAQGPAVPTEVDELIVTGTRLETTAFNSPSPVDVLLADDSALQGVFNATEMLHLAPIALGSTQLSGLTTSLVQNGGPGVNTISLRGLGDQRTLVLMNGRRIGPAGVQGQVGAVDLNVLPSAAIQRIEILKDGASSIYGSDAVAGVVNVITRSNLDGGLLTVDGTVPQEGGGEEYRISGAFGRTLDNGSRFQVSAEWYRREALTLGDRDFLDCAVPYVFDPTSGARIDMTDPLTGQPKCVSTTGNSTGYFNVYEAVFTGAGPAAVLYGRRGPISVFGAGAGADPNLLGFRDITLPERNYDPDIEDDTTVISPVNRYTIFADGELNLGSAEGYGEFLWSRRESEQKSWQTIFQPVSFSAPCSSNPLAFGCPGGSTRAYFSPPPATPGVTGRHLGFAPLTQFLAPNEQEQTVDFSRTVLGLRGPLAMLEGWDWDVNVTYSRSRAEYFQTGIYNDRMEAVTGTDAVGNFIGICPVGSAPGCTGLNFFTGDILTTGAVPQSYLDYLQIRETGETHYDQVVAEAVIRGPLFQAPGGQVEGAFGVSFRKDWLDDRPGEEAVAANYWGLATAGPTEGDDSLYEAFGEVMVPLVRDAAFARQLTVNLSGRYSNYDSYGSNGTYKAGVNWGVNDVVRVRATIGTSFRAPSLYEQSLNNQSAFLPQIAVDPCVLWGESGNQILRDNCDADGLPDTFVPQGGSATLLIGGGEDLEPEESTSRSIGIVLTPGFFDLQVSADYWEVEIEDEVVSLAAAVVGQCYAAADFPDNPYCDLFTRRSTGDRAITFVDASYRNIVSQNVRGVDFELATAWNFGPGRATLTGRATRTLEDSRELFAGREDDVNGLIGEPEVVAAATMRYDVGPWTATLSREFIGEQSNKDYQFGTECGAAGTNPFAGAAGNAAFCAKNHVEAVWYHHASVRYQAEGWSLTGGVRNLFDETVPTVSAPLADMGDATYTRIGNTPGASQYDLLGRRFFVSLTKTF